MKKVQYWLTACMVACATLTTSAALGQTTQTLISFDEMNIGNGNFNVTQEDQDNGLVGSINMFGLPPDPDAPAPEAPTTSFARHRVLRDIGATTNGGVFIPGWTNIRDFYFGGNGAAGFDGNYGFATPPYEAANGDSGQAFTNTGRVSVISDNYDIDFAAGATIDFNYLVGSDSINGGNGQPLAGLATPSLIFDLGLPTEFTEEFAQETGVGAADPDDATNLDFNRRSGTYVTTAEYQTVQLRFSLTNELQANDEPSPQGVARGLLDQVSLSVTGDPGMGMIRGDFDDDGDVDLDDLDRYIGNLGEAATGEFAALDLDESGTVDLPDFTEHYSMLVETSNGGKGTFQGDLNLDGTVDIFGDGFPFLENIGSAATSWSEGDFSADGLVDIFGDGFPLLENIGNTNGGAGAAPATSAVPEPGSLSLLALVGLSAVARRRR